MGCDADRLANRIKVWRAEKDMTQEELARRIGVSRKTVNTIERGVFVPSTIIALKLAREFGCSVEEIFELVEWGVTPPLTCLPNRQWADKSPRHSQETPSTFLPCPCALRRPWSPNLISHYRKARLHSRARPV